MSALLTFDIEATAAMTSVTRAIDAHDGVIFTGHDENVLAAWDQNTRQQLWTQPTNGRVLALAALANGTLAVASDGELVFFSTDGARLDRPDPTSGPNCFAFDSTGSLWTGEFSGFLHRINTAVDEHPSSTFFVAGNVEAVACTPSGLVITSGSDELVHVNDARALIANEDTIIDEIAVLEHHYDFGPVGAMAAIGTNGWISGGWSGELVIVNDYGSAEPVWVQPAADSITEIITRGEHVVFTSLDRTVRAMHPSDPSAIAESDTLGSHAHCVTNLSDTHLAVGTDTGFAIIRVMS